MPEICPDSPEPAYAVPLALGVAGVAVVAIVIPSWVLMIRASRWLTPLPAPATVVVRPSTIDLAAAERGEEWYLSACSVCHGADGTAMKEIGRDLPRSPMIKALDDRQLIGFIRRGVDASEATNPFKTAMPPSGGNPALTDAQMQDIVCFLRKLQQDASAGGGT